jgi:hypothetical protein
MSQIPLPIDKSATKPIYVITILNTSISGKGALTYIKTRQDLFNIFSTHIDIRGLVISKKEADKLKTNKDDRNLDGEQIHLMVPNHQWINAENISFNGIAK